MESRFPTTLHFADYTAKELMSIADRILVGCCTLMSETGVESACSQRLKLLYKKLLS